MEFISRVNLLPFFTFKYLIVSVRDTLAFSHPSQLSQGDACCGVWFAEQEQIAFIYSLNKL